MSEQHWPQWLPLRESLAGLSPYGAPQLPSLAQLNTNENPYPPSPELVDALTARIREVAKSLNRYPDRDAQELRKSLAQFLNKLSGTTLTVDQLWAANGSNEIIQSLFLAFGGRGALGFTPSYSMHPLIARVAGTQWQTGTRNSDFSLDLPSAVSQILEIKPGLIFITTPNNPTGTSLSIEGILALAKACEKVSGLLIVDEAYAEFSNEPSALTLLTSHPNIVVVRTMSKAFAFAGVRLGYLAAHVHVVEAMLLVRLPYHLSSLTQAAAIVALEHQESSLTSVATLIESRERVRAQLVSMGLEVIPSSANFLLFSINHPQDVWQLLLDAGVLIRDVGLSGYLRVTIGNDAENERFISALRNSLGGK
ncbi:MAG: histidinol-phosphate transaminase [Streptomycetaceae bacterium]|nr:MAG: histidinol-phosphate transaminase [Streptomycetaceae bacterium]